MTLEYGRRSTGRRASTETDRGGVRWRLQLCVHTRASAQVPGGRSGAGANRCLWSELSPRPRERPTTSRSAGARPTGRGFGGLRATRGVTRRTVWDCSEGQQAGLFAGPSLLCEVAHHADEPQGTDRTAAWEGGGGKPAAHELIACQQPAAAELHQLRRYQELQQGEWQRLPPQLRSGLGGGGGRNEEEAPAPARHHPSSTRPPATLPAVCSQEEYSIERKDSSQY